MNESLEKELTIVTPEQVQLQFQTAGVGSRAIAHVLDALLLALVNTVLILLLGLGRKYVWGSSWSSIEDYAAAIIIIVLILLNAGYFICTEAYMGGRTIGKKLAGLRVIQDNGQSATLLSVIIRNLFRLLDVLPMAYFLGSSVMLFSAKDKRIGDMVAGTIVIVELQRERMKRHKRIEKSLAAWRDRLPQLELDDLNKQSLNSRDWLLLQTWIEGLPTMSPAKIESLSKPITEHFAAKLQHHWAQTADSSAYLVACYLQLREDWNY